MNNKVELTDKEKQFLINCIYLSASESYYMSEFGTDCFDFGLSLARKLGADDEKLRSIERGF